MVSTIVASIKNSLGLVMACKKVGATHSPTRGCGATHSPCFVGGTSQFRDIGLGTDLLVIALAVSRGMKGERTKGSPKPFLRISIRVVHVVDVKGRY